MPVRAQVEVLSRQDYYVNQLTAAAEHLLINSNCQKIQFFHDEVV